MCVKWKVVATGAHFSKQFPWPKVGMSIKSHKLNYGLFQFPMSTSEIMRSSWRGAQMTTDVLYFIDQDDCLLWPSRVSNIALSLAVFRGPQPTCPILVIAPTLRGQSYFFAPYGNLDSRRGESHMRLARPALLTSSYGIQ